MCPGSMFTSAVAWRGHDSFHSHELGSRWLRHNAHRNWLLVSHGNAFFLPIDPKFYTRTLLSFEYLSLETYFQFTQTRLLLGPFWFPCLEYFWFIFEGNLSFSFNWSTGFLIILDGNSLWTLKCNNYREVESSTQPSFTMILEIWAQLIAHGH